MYGLKPVPFTLSLYPSFHGCIYFDNPQTLTTMRPAPRAFMGE
jgi:hypothetical protein